MKVLKFTAVLMVLLFLIYVSYLVNASGLYNNYSTVLYAAIKCEYNPSIYYTTDELG